MQSSRYKKNPDPSLWMDLDGQWLAGACCSAPRGKVSHCTGSQQNATAAWLCQQVGEGHTGPYCSDSYWEGKKLIPVVASSGPGCRKPLLTRVQSMAGPSQASQGTAQPRFYCICLNRIPRAGEFSPQHRKYPRHRRLHLILNCSFIFFYFCLNCLGLNFPW